MPKVNPELLVWARETAGFDLAEAAGKIGLRRARGVEPADRLAALERGQDSPTRALLVKMAKQYRRPLVVFYLGAPPRTTDRGEDFRTTLVSAPRDDEPLLDALMRDVLARQSLIRAALEAEDDTEHLDFVGAWDLSQGAERLASELSQILEFDRSQYRAAQNYGKAFALLRRWAEGAGVFVLLIGDLGSHHTAISVDTFRGYVLADDIAPFIVINDRDARAAWSFTLLHELCHLLLGRSGVSGNTDGSTQVERFCNDVASLLLVGDEEIRRLSQVIRAVDSDRSQEITRFARDKMVSRTLVAYRLQKIGALDFKEFSRLKDEFYVDWSRRREGRRVKARQAEGGPSYYVVRRHRIGDALLGAVAYLLSSGALTTGRAGQVLGVKPTNVSELLSVSTGSALG